MSEMFKIGTKRYIIASLHAAGLTTREAYTELRPKVAEQIKPWVFTTNVPNVGRQPKPLADQYIELQHEINRVYSVIARSGGIEIPRPEKVEEPAPKPRKKNTREEDKRHFVNEWKRLRRWIAETAERTGALPLDSLDSMRPVQAARALIDAGISSRTLIYAMTLHWPQVSREMAGIETADFLAESDDLGSGFHRLTDYVRKLAEARQNVMLIGPAGTGKSHIARQVASLIKTEAHPEGLPYGETPMTPGATRGDLLGRHTVNGFIPSQFVEIYSGGGIFNFEEIDASDPSMLIVVNNALASGHLFNSANGEVYEKHCDFIAVATANTFGLGSDSKYTGREKLDLATIDRFRMARVLVSLDENLAESLMFN
jgi:dynein-related subfamily AAA family protein